MVWGWEAFASPNAATLLFDPRLVHQMINSHSFIHLELLARRAREPVSRSKAGVQGKVAEIKDDAEADQPANEDQVDTRSAPGPD